jgi:hypothetical protein
MGSNDIVANLNRQRRAQRERAVRADQAKINLLHNQTSQALNLLEPSQALAVITRIQKSIAEYVALQDKALLRTSGL